ncbi:hypothetical protein ALC56_07788, partial [Trachymyrmex septentrionalis]
FVGSRYARKANCEFSDHIRLIIRAVSGSGVGDAGVTIEQTGKQREKQRSSTYRGRFSRTSRVPLSPSFALNEQQREEDRPLMRVLRNVV